MRLRVSFKLSGDSAELARKISEYSRVEIDDLAEMAFLSYLEHVVKATEKQIKEKMNANSASGTSINLSRIDNGQSIAFHSEEGRQSPIVDDSKG